MRLLTALVFSLGAMSASAATVAFRNVTVIPMNKPGALPAQTVVVRDDRIVAAGPARTTKIPKGATIVDGTGKYLIPGLAEMHGHIPPPTASREVIEGVLFLYAANGITTVRGMLGHPGQLELREKSRKGEILSPTLYLAGPSFNGQSINSPQEAIDRVRQQKKEGWDLLKVHPGLSRDEYDAMARTAREEGIRFGGHVPEDVGLLHAIEMGQETFDHLDGYVEHTGGDKEIDKARLAEAVRRTREAGAWVVPTMALWEVLYGTIDLDTLRSYPELKYTSRQSVQQWSTAWENRRKNPEYSEETARRVIDSRMRILRALHEGGVRVLMGTDAPQQFSIPGFSLHRELLRMEAAGMSPWEILKSGTANVGSYFSGSDSFGTIENGKRADLVLLDADPLAAIANVSRISGVMLRGRWLSRADIDARLVKIAASYK